MPVWYILVHGIYRYIPVQVGMKTLIPVYTEIYLDVRNHLDLSRTPGGGPGDSRWRLRLGESARDRGLGLGEMHSHRWAPAAGKTRPARAPAGPGPRAGPSRFTQVGRRPDSRLS
jgi:hypothetical protein